MVALVDSVTSKLPSALHSINHSLNFKLTAVRVNSFNKNRVLVVKDDIRPPDVLRRDVEHIDAAVIIRIPFQFVVVPVLDRGVNNQQFRDGDNKVLRDLVEYLLHPEVGRHDLILEVLHVVDVFNL